MNRDVIITCAVTGSGDTVGKHPDIPITPEQIATASIEAAKAGAAVAHIHVRDPETGEGCRDPHLYREVVERIAGPSRIYRIEEMDKLEAAVHYFGEHVNFDKTAWIEGS